ncbi:GIY-YIG nuclease family protein [Azospirillum tabaci]|uniref:GIY-YIG nuclease family protein n=1 Tax=Azospirillum tabaci TaxID=2752310 RepID=UPI001B3C10D3|nr:GIY-YIG nuclease family protein [Azospirillum tabaci]
MPFRPCPPVSADRTKAQPAPHGPRKPPTLHGYNRALLRTPVQMEPSGSAPFLPTYGMLVPDNAGVYLIHDLRGVLYVGRTNLLRRRFNEHFWIADNELLLVARRHPFGEVAFSWILVEAESDRATLERRLVSWLQPPCNRLIPGAPN